MDEERVRAVIEEMKRGLPRIDEVVMRFIKVAANSYGIYSVAPKGKTGVVSESKKIKKAVDNLLNKLENLDDNTYSIIEHFFKYQTEELGDLGEIDLYKFEYSLKRLSIYFGACANFKSRRGPKKNEALNHFIMGLANVYEYSTERLAKKDIASNRDHEEYKGEFFQFVLNCVKAGQIEFQSESALGRRITEILEGRKRTFHSAYKKLHCAFPKYSPPDYIPKKNNS